ncbi:alpha/beta hydrolase [Paenibacillus sedimenti]|uniref:Alpha/beta fold hydrolase n=1 Tax=Paenibacillus sedimenti TaxID=2770274 RepID=A0A926KVM7_9BACL|nr:alpha/beta fold hydrolase [Paenibacillus sedimenti]MBD0384001.1 alpha/beta fold hydrolase [Paenibacillus sedimenti]
MLTLISVIVVLLLLCLLLPFILIMLKPKSKPFNEKVLAALPKFKQDYSTLSERSSYATRDGSRLDYRYYPADSRTVVILLHGISIDGQYLHGLAELLSRNDIAQVYTPDLRGYGKAPARRGDCDYIGQLDDDLADLIEIIKEQQPDAKIVLGGHSAGGGTVIRFAGSQYGQLIQAYLLLAPAVSPNAPINYTEEESTRMVTVNLPRIIGLTILNFLGIKRFNHLKVLSINKLAESSDGFETLALSYRLTTSRMPGLKYQDYLRALKQPTLLLIGEDDEEFKANAYEPLFRQYNKADIRILPKGLSHDTMLLDPHTFNAVKQWIYKI